MQGESNQTNSCIPQFIAQIPWYSGQQHYKQQDNEKKQDINTWYQKGARQAQIVTKFRKGACTNCGAMTHTVKECCERPRKVGAKWSGKNIQQDEVIEQIELNWDGKRDRWNGFNPDMYSEIMKQWQDVQQDDKSDSEESDYANGDLVMNIDPRTKTVTKARRDREDTAAYLNELDPSVQDYDSKSRAQIDSLTAAMGQQDSQMYRDHWVKIEGGMEKLNEMESFLEQVNIRGNDVNQTATPSQSELLFKLYKQKKELLKRVKERSLIEMYGEQDTKTLQINPVKKVKRDES